MKWTVGQSFMKRECGVDWGQPKGCEYMISREKQGYAVQLSAFSP